MYLGKTLAVVGIIYIVGHVAIGSWHCYNNFCPGDNERDYVYTVKDQDGKIWYIENGKPVSEDEYKKQHANLFEFVAKENNNGKE